MREIRLFSIEGNRQKLDGGSMFGNAPKTLWSKWIPADEHNRIDLACRSLLIKTDNLNILLEAGIGTFFSPKLKQRFGVEGNTSKLLQDLNDLGIQQTDIHAVILSHLHFDHAGGIVPPWPAINDPDWQPYFPNAYYISTAQQIERSINPHYRDKASFVPGLAEKLRSSDRLILVDKEEQAFDPNNRVLNELNEFLSFYYSHGHTPGQLHTLIHGNKQKVFFVGDLMPGMNWVHVPISMGYDRYPEQLINEKEHLLNRAFKESWLLYYTHDPKHSMSSLKKGKAGEFIPFDPVEKLDNFLI